MKKVLLSLVAGLSILGLASCNGEDKPKDETAPVISGVQDLVCTVDQTINLLNGVTAVDETDGDITSNIEITLLPEMTVNNGSVTPTATGDYEVAYKVKDAAGNEGEAFATLAVTPALAPKTEYQVYTFGNADTNGWGAELKTDEGVEGSVGIVKGNYQINVTKSNGVDWHVKFARNFALTVGTDYTFTYNFISSVAGKVRSNGTEHDIVVGANTIVYKHYAESDNVYLDLQFGLLEGPYTIDFTSVKVEESVGVDTYTDITPSDFAFNNENQVSVAFDNEATGTLTTTADSAVIDITKGPNENGCWQVRAYVKAGLDLEADKKYRISVDVHSTAGYTDGFFEICYNNGDVEKGVGALYGQKIDANQTKTIEFTVFCDSAKDNLTLQFQLGALNATNGANTVTISNLKIEEVGGDKTVTDKTYTFTPEGFGTYNEAPAAGNLYTQDNKLVYEMTSIALTDWHNKMYIENILLEADKIYTISFKAKADKNISCAFFLNKRGEWDPRVSQTVNFTTEEQLFEFSTSSAFAADMAFEILWQFGSEANQALGSAKIEFSEIVIYAQDVQ
ncbi:MAG: hypothetical protein IJA65_04270 [Acholeplasmatales bacterium]|nr:hypothetical protein [Acholeplasmatales bacterium]